jgi:hypothetical protein
MSEGSLIKELLHETFHVSGPQAQQRYTRSHWRYNDIHQLM